MVLNSQMVVAVANISANVCQYIACNPEHLSSAQVLDLLFCFPFQQFRRLSLCLSAFFCFPYSSDPLFYPSPSSSSSSDDSLSSSSALLITGYDSHSD
ncbi:hypothetical protein BVRB_3g056140 [Beta vulgaris subsp. vulgaris]|nr:hypothetical protein BVRB_3g056140 [Beta vulgaris subsp. vulgaris]